MISYVNTTINRIHETISKFNPRLTKGVVAIHPYGFSPIAPKRQRK